MVDDTANESSAIDIQIGESRIHVQGSEEFIADELPDILEWVGNHEATVLDEARKGAVETSGDEVQKSGDGEAGENMSLEEAWSDDEGDHGFSEDGQSDAVEAEPDPLAEVAESINVDPDALSEHFYVDDDGVGIQNPREIDPKYALLGYGIIRKELTGDMYLDNKETKEKLIDQEMVDISGWGSNLLYGLRRNGLIKDDPNTDKGRNKPFKVTPSGFDEFIQWLEDQEGA